MSDQTLTPDEATAVQAADAALEPTPAPVAPEAAPTEPAAPATGDELVQHPNGAFEVRVLDPIRNEE